MRWAIAGFLVLLLMAAGCERRTSGVQASEYAKRREAALKEREGQPRPAARPAAVDAARGKQPAAAQAAAPSASADAEPKAASEQPAQAEPAPEAKQVVVAEDAYRYDATGKRDPFRSFVLDRIKELADHSKGPLEQFDLTQLSVVGVVWDASRRRALVEDPSGRGYVIRVGTPIGKNEGHVIEIADNLVLVRETYEDYLGDKTTKDIPMRIRQGQGG